jgi:NAD-reducing hydrogenase large subunit
MATLASIIQSHALSLFYLSSPDLLLGMDAEPAKRSLFGVAEVNPRLARDGVYLRKFGQEAVALMAGTGKRVHPGWLIPGGVSSSLKAEARDEILAMLPEALQATKRSITWYKHSVKDYQDEVRTFANFPSLFMGITGPDGELEYTDGLVRIVDSAGKIVADKLEPANYRNYIGEKAESWSYMKFPYYKGSPSPDNVLRVGPLARLNIVDKVDTPQAAQEWAEFQTLGRGAVLSSFHYHYARLIEILYCVEKLESFLNEPGVLNKRVKAKADPNCSEGVGVAEAPRGMLIHHYKIDENGLVNWVNMIIATGFNNTAINRGILQAAKHYIKGTEITEGALNRLEAVVRAFDPCLSCASHAAGQMQMHVQLIAHDGTVVNDLRRD